MAAVDKFTQTTEILWEKRDGRATLSVRERARGPESLTPAWTGFYCFSGHITLRMALISHAQVCFRGLQKTKERMLLITSKRKDICKLKGKVVELVILLLGRFSIDFRKLL